MTSPMEKFAFQVLAGTKADSMEWRTTGDQTTFAVNGDSGTIILSEPREHAVRLEVRDASQNAVGSIETEPERPTPWRPWEEALNELYELAALKARGTTDVLNGMMAEFGLPKDVAIPAEDDIPF